MTNQVILWSLLIVPWLSLFFMRKEDIKRWMPAALFTIVTSTIITDAGVALKMWVINENVFFLNEMVPVVYGPFPVLTLWILKFTYGRFWLYALTQIIASAFFNLILQPWLGRRGIWVPVNATLFLASLPSIPHFASIYLYQMWQEGVFVRSQSNSYLTNLQPAAAKPMPESQDNEKDTN